MKKKSFVWVGLVGLVSMLWSLGLIAPAPASAAGPPVYKMDMAAWPPGGPYLEQLKMFAKRVEAYSGGRIKVNLLAGGMVCPSTKEFDALESGAIKWGGRRR